MVPDSTQLCELFLTGCMTFGESLPLSGQSPLGCPHLTDIFCYQGLGLEKKSQARDKGVLQVSR